ncbi:MAG: anti-sigma factor [Rhodospirillales bacterium]|nr:anti-sigma factor [Rhodospirillales bacterium]
MTTGRPITEEDLHAYVDEALDITRRDEVEAYLRQHPDVALRVQSYVNQRNVLRAMLAPVAEEPIPPALSLARLAEVRRRPPAIAPWRAVAASILLFSFGAAGGWTMHGMSQVQPTGMQALAQDAAYNYAVYGPDNLHPVEFNAADRGKFVDWISGRLNTPVMVPDLSISGYRFMGGRLVATGHGPAGLLMYSNNDGLRIIMLVQQMNSQKTSKMMQSKDGAVTGFTWTHGGLGYSVAGTSPADTLHPLADEIRRQVNLNI